ncbi:MAG TPA: hypothetical protein VJY54_13855, partial [Lachnospiraceae bacterium]|nr:hypothetical protein [Lachnospiraceae bacterium]
VLAELKSREKYYTYDTVSQLQTDKIKINKTTNINITKDLTNADINKVTIETVYDYSVSNYPYNKSDGSLDTFDKTFTSLSSLFVMYDNSATVSNGAKLENIYVFYYPAYNSSDTGVRINSETININNNTGVEKKVYLIKQVNGYLTPGQRETCENSYTPQINNSGDSIQLYHNLNTNLANPSGTVGAVDNNVVNSHTDILPTDTKVLVYDVQISIYEQGAAASNFTAAIPLLTLDGSMNDD